jgi:hypothetical protein
MPWAAAIDGAKPMNPKLIVLGSDTGAEHPETYH